MAARSLYGDENQARPQTRAGVSGPRLGRAICLVLRTEICDRRGVTSQKSDDSLPCLLALFRFERDVG
jgi:hypothetical protein